MKIKSMKERTEKEWKRKEKKSNKKYKKKQRSTGGLQGGARNVCWGDPLCCKVSDGETES